MGQIEDEETVRRLAVKSGLTLFVNADDLYLTYKILSGPPPGRNGIADWGVVLKTRKKPKGIRPLDVWTLRGFPQKQKARYVLEVLVRLFPQFAYRRARATVDADNP